MNPSRSRHIVLSIAAGSLLLVLLLLMVRGGSQTARAEASVLFVKQDGSGSVCSRSDPCALEEALSQADGDDTLVVAGGRYTGTGDAVVNLSESVALLGGWDATDTQVPVRDPKAYATTLDGEDQRRVIYIHPGITVTLDGLIIACGNASDAPDARQGGGIYAHDATLILRDSVISNNLAYSGTDWGQGGGTYLLHPPLAVISGSTFLSSTANAAGPGKGGGLAIYEGCATIQGNTFRGNIAGLGTNAQGGGLYLECGEATVVRNLIEANRASPAGNGLGGGLYGQLIDLALSGNTLIRNCSDHGTVFLQQCAGANVVNNLIADNCDGFHGFGSETYPLSGVLINNTIARNEVDAVHLGFRGSGYASLRLVNNIIVSHTTAIYVPEDPTTAVTATHTLLYGNDTDMSGTRITSTNEITGSVPRFRNPAVGDYHLLPDSPAIDAGIPVPWLTLDLDGEARPAGAGYDIGADEFHWRWLYMPLIVGSAEE